LYGFVEQWGNIRLQRISFCYCQAIAEARGQRQFLRFTGLADHHRLKEYFQKEKQLAVVREEKGLAGEPITVLCSENGPVWLLVGDTDLILAVEEKGRSLKGAEQVLEVLAGKKASLLQGPWAGALNDIPEEACGLLIGDPRDTIVKELGAIDGPVPHRLIGHLIAHESIDIHFTATMSGAADVRAFAQNLINYRERNLASLKELAHQSSSGVLLQAWESIKVETNGLEVRGAAHLSSDLPSAVADGDLKQVKDMVKLLEALKGGVEAILTVDLKSPFAFWNWVAFLLEASLRTLLFVIVVAGIAAVSLYLRQQMLQARK
jgi:hypothetical protein